MTNYLFFQVFGRYGTHSFGALMMGHINRGWLLGNVFIYLALESIARRRVPWDA